MPACRSISTRRRTSSKGAKYRHRRNACLQEHFDEAAHELQRGEVPTQEKCLLAGAFRRGGARAPSGRSWGVPRSSVIPKRSEESPRKGRVTTNGGSLTRAFGLVRDDVRKYACWDDMRGSTPHPPSPPLCKGVSRALCASPRCGVRAWRTEVFAIVGKNRDRWRPWQAIEKSRRKGCPARAAPIFTTLPPRSARHPPE